MSGYGYNNQGNVPGSGSGGGSDYTPPASTPPASTPPASTPPPTTPPASTPPPTTPPASPPPVEDEFSEENIALSIEEGFVTQEKRSSTRNLSSVIEPFTIRGYYPLYSTADGADAASPDGSGHHTHRLNDTLYYMPNGLVMGETQFHGDYGDYSSSTPTQRLGVDETRIKLDYTAVPPRDPEIPPEEQVGMCVNLIQLKFTLRGDTNRNGDLCGYRTYLDLLAGANCEPSTREVNENTVDTTVEYDYDNCTFSIKFLLIVYGGPCDCEGVDYVNGDAQLETISFEPCIPNGCGQAGDAEQLFEEVVENYQLLQDERIPCCGDVGGIGTDVRIVNRNYQFGPGEEPWFGISKEKIKDSLNRAYAKFLFGSASDRITKIRGSKNVISEEPDMTEVTEEDSTPRTELSSLPTGQQFQLRDSNGNFRVYRVGEVVLYNSELYEVIQEGFGKLPLNSEYFRKIEEEREDTVDGGSF